MSEQPQPSPPARNGTTGVVESSAVGLVVDQLASAGKGFEQFGLLPGSTFEDSRTIVIVPTRGSIPHQVTHRWLSLITPMNQARGWLFAAGHEVGRAYDALIAQVLAHPELSRFKYVLTLEDDNLPPPDAQVRLLESIQLGPFDAVSGLYFTKGQIGMPMAYGDPEEFRTTGVLDFKPLDVRRALQLGRVVPVNGIAMGCALWRLDLFRQIPPPWFVTVADVVEERGGVMAMTQDLYFCRRAREAGKTFAVDCRVRVGHLDISTGEVF